MKQTEVIGSLVAAAICTLLAQAVHMIFGTDWNWQHPTVLFVCCSAVNLWLCWQRPGR